MNGVFELLIVPCIVAGLLLFLSLRLHRTAFRVDKAEGWLGTAFLCVAISIPICVFPAQKFVRASHTPILLLTSHALMVASLCGLTLVIDCVFRPDDAWTRAIATALILLQFVTPPALVFFGGHRDGYGFLPAAQVD